MSGSLNNSYSSWLYLFLHIPFSCTALKCICISFQIHLITFRQSLTVSRSRIHMLVPVSQVLYTSMFWFSLIMSLSMINN
jgi:hypothetical protein